MAMHRYKKFTELFLDLVRRIEKESTNIATLAAATNAFIEFSRIQEIQLSEFIKNDDIKMQAIKQEIMSMGEIISMQKESYSRITLMLGELFNEIKWRNQNEKLFAGENNET